MKFPMTMPRWTPSALLMSLVLLGSAPAGIAAAATPEAGTQQNAEAKEKKMTKTDSGLEYRDTTEGDGATPAKGQTCVMHYTGWLWENGEKGRKFDSSVDRGEPFAFRLGVGQVIAGWDEGVATMKTGGKRELRIPPDLGYGPRGAGGVIPPNATLFFEVELLEIK